MHRHPGQPPDTLKDAYLTISRPATGEFRDRGSKFLAYAFPVDSEEAWQRSLEKVKKDHPKARHHCYAYRIGLTPDNFRANDDGEPSGTAGRPILGQIDSAGLTNVLVVVVRYFGGTLLGTSGLINAYKTSAKKALEKAQIIEKLVENRVRIQFDYAHMGEVMNAVKRINANIVRQHFQENAFVDISIRKSETTPQLLRLKAILAKVSTEEARQLEDLPGISIQILEH